MKVTTASALVASSDRAFREKALIALERAGIALVAQATNESFLAALIGAFQTDLLLLDVDRFDGEAVRRLPDLHLASPRTAILLAFGELSDECVEPALREGVRGFVAKSSDSDHYARAIDAMVGGEIWLSRSKLSHTLLHLIEHNPVDGSAQAATRPAERLSPREREIVRLIACGRTNKEIAKALGTSDKTVKAHVSHALARLGLKRRTQIATHPQVCGAVAIDRAAPPPAQETSQTKLRASG